jgi:DNA polymerase-4
MPLRVLFIDMNAYFASVEQQDEPKLRGRPVAVVPVEAATSSCIAASYEAKACGVRTGTPVWEARKLCPNLVLRVGRHDRYVEIHHQIVRAVGRCIPVSQVMSIDEMACRLLGDEREPDRVARIARHIKREIRDRVGNYLRCSIGVGPNTMLAKVAGDMQKPDGYTVLRTEDLPTGFYRLKLTDFPGIGPRMERRFHRMGITTVQQLLALKVGSLSAVWGSRVHGERWFHLLRGDEVPEIPTVRRTVSHSHVLPPELRTEAGARGVLVKLIHKAAARLRTIDYWAGHLGVSVRHRDGSRWEADCHLARCQDTLNMLKSFGVLWEKREPGYLPLQVGMMLSDLVPSAAATPSLFEQDRQVTTLSHVMDQVNRTFGKNSIHFGTLAGAEETAPTRIAFTRIPEFNPAHI